jgi:hypothetical protein
MSIQAMATCPLCERSVQLKRGRYARHYRHSPTRELCPMSKAAARTVASTATEAKAAA